MTELTRNIHNSIFGETPTKELLSMAFEKRKVILAIQLLTVQKYLFR